jgi:hypothetical protein
VTAANNSRIIHDGNSGIEGEGLGVGVGDANGDGEGVGAGGNVGIGVIEGNEVVQSGNVTFTVVILKGAMSG